MISLFGLEPAEYRPHPLHSPARTYAETNCYADVLIELLHAHGNEPLAMLGSTVRVDFEGDQWTFFKPHPADLERLFGVDVHEMQPYRALPNQIAEHLAHGRTLIVELDSWYLPDTAATSYRIEHVKTSVALEGIDLDAQRLRYFHNLSLHELAGEDYRGVFRIDAFPTPEVLPPYAELVRFDAGPSLRDGELRREAHNLLAYHLERRPRDNPFERFGVRLSQDLPRLVSGDAAEFHAYAFATVRMAGSAFEALSAHLDWLFAGGVEAANERLGEIVDGCKLLSLKLARRRPFDAETALEPLAKAWLQTMSVLDAVV